MKAWFARHYGGPEVLRLEQTTTPTPGPGEVLIRIHATTVNSGDVRIRGCDLPRGMKTLGRLALGWNRPRQPVLGTECAGVIERVGEGVSRWQKGDAVFAFSGMKQGAHAQYMLMREDGPLAPLPANLDFHQAASLSFGGTTALHYLRKAGLKRGQSILVLGGSSAVGIAIIQLAQAQGASVAATTSTRNLDLVAGYGAAPVLDYTQTGIGQIGERFDCVADCVSATNFASAQALLKPNGRYLAIAGAMKEMFGSLRPGRNGTRMIAGPAAERVEDVVELGRLAAKSSFVPYIDKVFAFEDLPAAHAYVDTGRKRGSVVIAVAE